MERHGDVLAHRQRGIERVELEHHGDVALLRRQIVHALPGDDDVARRGALEAGDHAQRRRLAAARRAEQADHFAGRDRKVGVPHGDERAELLGDFADLDRGHGYFFTVPKVTPRSRCSCRKKVTRKTGMRNRVSIAASSVQSVPRPPEDTAWFIATGTVRVSGPVSSSANRNSFQVRIRPKTKVAARPAITCGRQILIEHLGLGRAVDAGGILDVGRKLVEEALHHPDGEGEIEGGVEQDDAEIGAGKAHHAEHQDDRDDDDDRRQHAGRQDDEQIGVVALQRIAREAVGRQRAEDEGQQDRGGGDHDRVEEEAVEAGRFRLAARRHHAGEHRAEILQRRA